LVFEALAKVSPFSYNSSRQQTAPKRCRKGGTMNRIAAKGKVVNDGEVEMLRLRHNSLVKT